MNERIKELAREAGLKHHNWITNESNVKDGDFKYPRLEDYEKFAELIVRECVQVARAGIEFGPSMEEAVYTYFGVEE